MKAVILEDERLATNRLIRQLNEVAPEIDVVSTFETIVDTVQYLENTPSIELLFLDIHVADGNSFELFNLINFTGKVIFTTAYDTYAIEAFRKNAIDYLLKPIKKEHLIEAVEKATPVSLEMIPGENLFKKRLTIKFLSKIHSIKVEDIAYIFSKNKVSYFYLKDGKRFPSDYKLQELEELLNPTFFFRANRQFIVHIDAITQITKHQASRVNIKLKPPIDTNVIVSTEKTPSFKKWLDK